MNPSNVSTSIPSTTGASAANEPAPELKTAAAEKARQLRDAATASFNRAKEESARIATEKKSSAADRVGGYGSAIHDTARGLEEKDPNLAWLTHRAADRIEGVANYIRSRDLRELKSDAEDLARRHPLAFFGGLFVAGLVVGNLLKASGRSGSDLQGLGRYDDNEDDRPASETANVPPPAAAPTGGTESWQPST
jgi:hypothetical protein